MVDDDIKVEQVEDPQLQVEPIDEAVAMLSILEVVKTDTENRRHVVRTSRRIMRLRRLWWALRS